MTIATELPASDPSSTSTLAPGAPGRRPGEQTAPITMLNPDFPFSYDHYLAHPDGLGSADVVHEVWHEMQEQNERLLRSITLKTLVDRQADRETCANYSI